MQNNILPTENKKSIDLNTTLIIIDALKSLMQLIPEDLRLQVLPENVQTMLISISDKFDKIKNKLPNLDPVSNNNVNFVEGFGPETNILPREEKKSDEELSKVFESVKALIQLLPSQLKIQLFPDSVQKKIDEMIENYKKIEDKVPDFDPVIYENEDLVVNEISSRKIQKQINNTVELRLLIEGKKTFEKIFINNDNKIVEVDMPDLTHEILEENKGKTL